MPGNRPRMTGEPAAVRTTIRRLVGYLRPHWRAQTVAVVASLVAVSSDLPIPLLIKILVDDVATAGRLDLLASALAGIGALAVVQAAASITSDYLFTTAGQQAVNVLRGRPHAARPAAPPLVLPSPAYRGDRDALHIGLRRRRRRCTRAATAPESQRLYKSWASFRW